MFVACWVYDPEAEHWVTTGRSVNIDKVRVLLVREASGPTDMWEGVAYFAGNDAVVLFGDGPNRDEVLTMMGKMLIETEVGYWPHSKTTGAIPLPDDQPSGRPENN